MGWRRHATRVPAASVAVTRTSVPWASPRTDGSGAPAPTRRPAQARFSPIRLIRLIRLIRYESHSVTPRRASVSIAALRYAAAMGSPYRERPRFLLCPRCGEMLDRVFEGVSSCLRCEGLWIAPATLDAAFGNPRWPDGHTLWWRNSLACPECAFEGKTTLMAARMSSDVLVDQCPEHGVWLDRGELGRLMGGATDEIGALRDRLAVMSPELEQLITRREQWRADIEVRRKASADYREALEEEHRRRASIAEAERARLDAEARARAASVPPSPQASSRSPQRAARAAPSPPAADPLEAARRAAQHRQELGTQRAQASAKVARLQGELAALYDHVRRLDAELAETRQRANSVQHELDVARAQLRTLDDQLDGP
jgi:Zn-finger nucleic acid-binding protein